MEMEYWDLDRDQRALLVGNALRALPEDMDPRAGLRGMSWYSLNPVLEAERPNPFTNEILKEIHTVVYDKPYDIIIRDWVEAYFKNDPHPQKISRFWCSALVAFIYTKVGLFDSSLDWSIIRPSFFSSENPDLNNKYLNFQFYLVTPIIDPSVISSANLNDLNI
jgi:hypothetical protein